MRAASLLLCSVALALVCAASSPALASLTEDFNDPTHAAQWTTWHEACFLQSGEGPPHESVLAITQGRLWGANGQAWYSSRMPSRQFVADFQFEIHAGPGSYWPAGITFGWVSDINEAWGAGYGAYWEHVNQSWTFGYPGNFVTFQSFEQERSGHGQVWACDSHPTYGDIVSQIYQMPWVGSNWYDARVRLDPNGTDARVRVWLDDDGNGQVNEALAPILDYSISDYKLDTAYFGFTGAAGWVDAPQRVDNVRLTSGSPVPEPASCALLAVAIGGIGAMLKRRKRA